MNGVLVNTDFIDNSAGVDTSDHEVNIKILLGSVVADGDMTLKQRNALLARMTDEVAELVLRDNYLQTQALSRATSQGIEYLDDQARFLRLYDGLLPKFRVVAVCGRVSSGLKKGFYSSLVRLAARRGCFTVFDTSGPVLAEALAAGAEGIKINRLEFEELSGSPYTPGRLHAFFKRHAPRGLKTLIVTDGAGHTHAASPFGLWRVTPPRLGKLHSPTGAGDSFMAGFLFGFLNGYDFERTLKLATGASSSDCLSVGAGLINRAQALTYAQKARVVKLA